MSNRTRWVVVDDDDPSFQFTGDWMVRRDPFAGYRGFGTTYRGSQHGTNTSGNLTFSYIGKEIVLYGTSAVARNSNDDGWTPEWHCQIDGEPVVVENSYPGPANNFPLCSWDGLFGRGDFHTLFVNATAGDGGVFWVDSIRYRPEYDARLEKPTVLIEHTDPSIMYTAGNWQTITDSHGDAILAMQPGSALGVAFTGTKLTWVGWTPDNYPRGNSTGTYSLDGGEPVTFDIQGLPSTYTLRNQYYFELEDLEPGVEHTLVVEHKGSSTPLVLDYLLVEEGDFRMPTNPTKVTPSMDDSSPSSSARVSEPAHHSKDKPPVGAIVGGVIGGLALIVILILGILFYKRRSRRHNAVNGTPLPPAPYTEVPAHNSIHPPPLPPAHPIMTTSHTQSASLSSMPLMHQTNPSAQFTDDSMAQASIVQPFIISQASLSNTNLSADRDVKPSRLSPLRRGQVLDAADNIVPFTPSDTTASSYSVPSQPANNNPGGYQSMPQGLGQHNPAHAFYGAGVAAAGGGANVDVVVHQDSGLRIPPRPVVNLPPVYTRE
ncbi:hypothetical protein CC1G_10556 [Coprinopsis cinerea okayama7|uniref:Uncharacterized protein n=1 Tax=Coprinopsis cinerea (strain Okayama-7 / 130 / ATCC MYA-4618 / FGSC 9003) TaxID=240176 RepID=A8NDX0_COPC7|nr:hypothetical protein CC1G_10556 [Coprinopsis cinerea okayama7\|eukprot:XP_001832880.1 hypothetical protein CC1G_10556 [Coprinopsis cinerea okayama7\